MVLVYARCGLPRSQPIEIVIAETDGSVRLIPLTDNAAMSLIADLAGFLAARPVETPSPRQDKMLDAGLQDHQQN